ncbi:MAG TPA: hypothetical protein VFX59_12405, partial [Polyangiales bacterium]|nr:hypothetical protein [Polyangiales bacterium]
MDEVVRAFEALPEVEQRALALLVALHRPASRSDFTRLLRSADIRRRDGKAFAITELLPILEGWQKGQLVKQDGPGAWAADARSQHALAAHLAERKLLAVAVDRVRELEPMQAPYSVKVSSIVRELFLALYVPRHPNLTAYVNAVPQQHGEQSLHTRAYGLHAPLAVLQRTDAPDAQLYLETTLPLAVADLLPLGEGVLSFVREAGSTFARASAAQYLAMRGQPAQAITGDATDACSHAARAFVALTQDELTRAREHARAAIEQTRARNKRIKGLTHPLWPWVTLLLLTDQAEPSSAALALEQLASCRRTNRQQFEVLQGLEGVQRTLQEAKGARRLDCYPSSSSTWLELVIWQAALTLAEQPPPSQFEGLRQPWLEVARSAGFTWAARALQGLSLASKEAPWERALRALERTLHQSPTSEPAERTERLAWVLETVDGRPRVTPRLQTQRGARFSGGRPISLRRLFEAKS